MMLEDIEAVFLDPAHACGKIKTTELVAYLGGMDERPWPEWKHGKPITARQLAKLLAPLKIKPGPQRVRTEVFKGYSRADFDDAISRYVSSHSGPAPLPSGYGVTGLGNNSNSEKLSVTSNDVVTDGNSDLFNKGNGVTSVTDGNGVRAENEPKAPEWEAEA